MTYRDCWSDDEFIEAFDRRCRRRLARAMRRRIRRWGEASTWRPPHANRHARADLHRDAIAAGRDAWRAEVDALAACGRPIPPAVVRHVWAMHEQRLRHAAVMPPDELRVEHVDALRHLFDFSTAPVTFTTPSASVDQHVFLPDSGATTAPTLDDLAVEVSAGSGRPGLYCLAGLPGSGKTTALRRIECLARHQPRPPVTLRLDLSPGIDPRTFLPRLTADLCRAVRHHCRRPPHALPLRPNFAWFALAHVAHFCHAYRIWAAGLLVPLAVFGLYRSYTTGDPLPAWACVAAVVAFFAVIFLGTCAALSRFMRFTVSPWLTLLLLTVAPAAGLVCQTAGYAPVQFVRRTATSATLNPPAAAGFCLAALVATGLAVLFLPPWWPAYTRAAALLRRRRILEQSLHDLLADCRRTFGGGVLLLVDGADHLPVDDLRQLLRLLRPLARCDAARTVLAVPRFVPAALHAFADPDTPVHRCLLLADPHTRPGDDDDAPLTRHEFEDLLRRLLCSRLRIPVAGRLSPTDPPLSLALAPWVGLSEDALRHIRLTGPTRRDLIRECEAVLLDPTRRPFPPGPGRDLPGERDLLRRLRAEHPALLADLLRPAVAPRLAAPPDLPAYYVATPAARPPTPEPV